MVVNAKKLMKERKVQEKEIYEDEELLDDIRDNENMMLRDFKSLKSSNEDILDSLDQ